MQNATPSRATKSPGQILAQQKIDAEKRHTQVPAVAPKASTAVALPDNRTTVQKYVDDVAPASFPGRLVKFTKEGKFVVSESGDEISPDTDFVALCDETLVGWLKFSSEEGLPPERVQGLLFDGFEMPARESLGDTDPDQWPVGLSGHPEDPWLHQQVLVLQDRAAGELFSFATSSKTGRRAVGNLLRHYERLQRQHLDTYPIVRLKAGGFAHKDDRIGWVCTPGFVIVGRAPKASAATPDGSIGADMNDELPF